MFITFEGVEGAGKSTQIGLVARMLRDAGRDPLVTRQPGGCPLGLELRRLLLDARNTGLDPRAELFMMLADRAQHVAEVIRPTLESGRDVLCDRFHDSTLAYQGHGRGLDLDLLRSLGDFATRDLTPDLTVLLDLDPGAGLARARGRNAAQGIDQAEGRFEALELAFHQRVRQGFLDIAAREPGRVLVVDAGQKPDGVFERIRAALAPRLVPAQS